MRKIWQLVFAIGILGVFFWWLMYSGTLQTLLPYAFGEIHRAGQL